MTKYSGDNEQEAKQDQNETGSTTNNARRVGLVLLLLSTLLYVVALGIVPFLALTADKKVLIGGVLALTGEVAFWVGGFFVGKGLIKKYRALFNPVRWLKRKDQP